MSERPYQDHDKTELHEIKRQAEKDLAWTRRRVAQDRREGDYEAARDWQGNIDRYMRDIAEVDRELAARRAEKAAKRERAEQRERERQERSAAQPSTALPNIRGRQVDGFFYVRAADVADALERLAPEVNRPLIQKLRTMSRTTSLQPTAGSPDPGSTTSLPS